MAIKTFTTGEVLTAADTNTFLANAGLDFIKQVTIGTAVTSVAVTNVFSATYDSYLTIYSVHAQSANATVAYSHNVSSGSNYFVVGQEMAFGSTTVTGIGPAGTTSCRVGRYDSGLGRVFGQVIVHAPNSATRKMGQFFCTGPGYGNHGQLTITTSSLDTGLTLAPSTGTWTGGTITVYGYRLG